MKPLDWWVLVGSLVFIVLYGLWRSRGERTASDYLLAGKSMPWYAMALSIMATQASAITFISTTGQAYVDGMRFVQFYFGLPLAMIILSATAVPIFHRAGVYTAYEYLEKRFDAKTRTLVTLVFLLQRGLACGISLYAPAVVLTVILGWPDQWTTLAMGAIVVTYTVIGGIKAVTWTDFQQMLVMMFGLFVALYMAVHLLPDGVGFLDALRVAGAAGRLNPVTFTVDWNDRYNLWSGLIGGMFLALAYFGTDQSQVQRYLSGSSIAQSRLSLLFNAVAKIPMQFLILLTGAMVFVFFTFERPPVVFHHEHQSAARQAVGQRFDQAFEARRDAALALVRAEDAQRDGRAAELGERNREFETVRKEALSSSGGKGFNDTNYIFLTFVTKHLPAGLVGLIMTAIFAAAMSTISAEINSLATVSIVDIYKRFVKPSGSDSHYVRASMIATALWGAYAILTARFGRGLGSLIEVVNLLGSLFYGGMLGVFVLAFYFPRIGGTAAFIGVLAGEAAIFFCYGFTAISFLWYNVIGCAVVLLTAHLAEFLLPPRRRAVSP